MFSATIDTGSPSSFVNKRAAEILLAKDPNARIISLDRNPINTTYVDYNYKPIKFFGILEIDIYSTGENLKAQNSENRTRCLLALHIQPELGIVTTKLKPPKNSINANSEEQENESAELIFWKIRFVKNIHLCIPKTRTFEEPQGVHPIQITTNSNSGEGQKGAKPHPSKNESRNSET